ncbi:MAG: hypothetical protein JJU24_16560 [Natronohydrobacter sp.]|nr:hypothetical protein [Natronohydrobacter sp.]
MPLETCLARALDGLTPVPAEWAETGAALGLVLAEDLCLPQDMPPACEAQRAGLAVAALDLVGASAGSPIPLWNPVRVVPGEAFPSGMDALLPVERTDTVAGCPEAVQPVSPGEGVRRTGHDGRADTVIARAGTRLAPRHRPDRHASPDRPDRTAPTACGTRPRRCGTACFRAELVRGAWGLCGGWSR